MLNVYLKQKLFLFFLILFLTVQCFCSEKSLVSTIQVEHARSAEELRVGLMGRKTLNEDYGMLFHFPDSYHPSIWSFNCFIDLSVAFLDQDGVIQEIHNLIAYPELMSLLSEQEIEEVMNGKRFRHPVVSFFQQHAIRPQKPALYVIETRKGWFRDHHIRQGDQVVWNDHEAFFYRQK
ncbi:MAG: hypothetical protein Tsb0021_11100 [Chlamydiales bacterium]